MVVALKARTMTAKKGAANGGGKQSLAQETTPKQQTESADRMREMAEHLRMHASLLELFADKQEAFDNPPLNMLSGNFYFALEGIRAFMQSQIVGKIMSAVKPATAVQAITLGDMLKRIGEMEQAMPEKTATKEQA